MALKKLTIEDMQTLAAKKGGRCLSDTYVNSKSKLLWECAKGHTWQAVVHNIKQLGQWCPVCAKTNRRASSYNF